MEVPVARVTISGDLDFVFLGNGLNPLLQDPGLAFHPPFLYLGYVGFSMAFSFAVAALIEGRVDPAWARWVRPWTLAAWCFLTIGIAMGSWWAYYELGWGGWWFWDPVENASFMPWLVGTALMHSLAVAEKRSAFKSWTVLLAIMAFSLSLLGTFLVRSGVLTSVHAFANDPARGVFILIMLAVVVGASLMLYAWRGPQVKGTGTFAMVSRETALLANNVLLVVVTATILLGTIYPLFMDAFGLGKISVGPPYFNTVFVPLTVPLALVMGIGPLIRWKQDAVSRLAHVLRLSLAVSIAGGVLMPWMWFGQLDALAMLGVGLGIWITLTILIDLRNRMRNKKSLKEGLLGQSRSFYGMSIAHLGVAVTVIGITLTSHYSTERDLRMKPGETVDIGGYEFLFDGVSNSRGPNYDANVGMVTVSKNGKHVETLRTEKRIYRVQRMPMTEAGIDAGLFRDLYVALGEPLGDNAWALRVYHKPFVRWIWLGALLMSFGGLLAASDRRYRLAARRERETRSDQGNKLVEQE